MHRRKKRTKEQVAKAERARDALDLSLRGFDYAEIGEKLQVSKATAWRIVQRAIERIPAENAEKARKVSLARLEAEWRRTGRVLEGLDLDPDPDGRTVLSIARMQLVRLRIEQRRAALLGLDAPRPQPIVQVNIAAPERPNLAALSADELRTMRRLQAKALAASDENIITVEAEHVEPRAGRDGQGADPPADGGAPGADRP